MTPASGRQNGSNGSLLIAGEIGKPHGTAGEVYVVRISDDPRRFETGSRLLQSGGRELVVERSRAHRDRFLVKFEGIESRDQAEELRGTLFIRSDERRELEEAEYWSADVIGCHVVTVDGEDVGEVRDVIPGTAQDLISVHTAKGVRLIPLVKEFIVSIDVAERLIRVDPPEGLLE